MIAAIICGLIIVESQGSEQESKNNSYLLHNVKNDNKLNNESAANQTEIAPAVAVVGTQGKSLSTNEEVDKPLDNSNNQTEIAPAVAVVGTQDKSLSTNEEVDKPLDSKNDKAEKYVLNGKNSDTDKKVVKAVGSAKVLNNTNFNDKFYNKHKIGVGYEFQYNVTAKDQLNNTPTKYSSPAFDQRYYEYYSYNPGAKNSHNQALTINVGENLYYKSTEKLHLFAGLDAQVRIPTDGKVNVKFLEGQTARDNSRGSYDRTVDLNFVEHARFDAKIGAKVNASKYFAFEVYGLGGVNLATAEFEDVETFNFPKKDISSVKKTSSSKVDVGFNVGGGFETIVNDRYTAGIEYRYSKNDFSFQGTDTKKFKNHSVGIKLGIQF